MPCSLLREEKSRVILTVRPGGVTGQKRELTAAGTGQRAAICLIKIDALTGEVESAKGTCPVCRLTRHSPELPRR